MNITELDSFNLADAVKFHDRLNPRLWDRNEHLNPEVHAKLREIARDFQEFLGVPDLDVKDITVSGSNAAYNYTPKSDIDLHLVVDLPAADNNEVYRELFDAKKFQYNAQHNIQIGGYDVELYVQNPNEQHHSQGIYSLLKNDWVSVPKRRKAEIDDISTKSKYEDLAARIDSTVASGDHDSMAQLMKKIKGLRQSGLEKNGEFGADNLAFKLLRNNGYIKKLVDARNAARDRELSLDEAKKKKKKVKYGFGTYWYPGFTFGDGGEGGGDGGGGESRLSESPDGVNPSTKMFLEEPGSEDESTVRNFIDFVADYLGIAEMPEIVLHTDPEWSRQAKSFGRYTPETHTLEVNLANRHIMDTLRTTAHELVHCRQNQERQLPSEAGETGSKWENQAHAIAGVIMRDYADQNPAMFESSGYIPTAAQANDPRFKMALTKDVRPGQTGKEANKMALKTDAQGRPALLMKSTNLREGRMPQPSQGQGRYKDLNEPLGPETPPTMPAGTVRVDVSDVYDWYKLGQHISNMKGLGKHDFGAGPPSSIISFGDEETEHKFIKDLEATGLDVTDIDPKDPKQPAGMRRIKTDPTYNVSEGVLEDNMAANDKSIANIRSKLTLVPFFTNPKTNTPVWVYDNSGRYTVVVQYGGMNLPFYWSTGMGGKETVAAEHWYPFFGVGTGPKGWINKGSEEEINNYYGSGILKNISKFLDSTFFPVRDPKNVWGYGQNRGLEDEFKKVVNRNFPETQDSGSRREGYTADGFARNANPYLKALGGMQYKTSDSSTDTKPKTDVAPPPSKPTPAPTVGKEITGPLTLQHNGKEFTTLSISANLGRNSVRQLGDDYKFWHDDQFQLQKDNKDNTWTLIPNNAATNKTIINGQGVTTPVKLKQGMVISVGNPDKKIEKLPITVISKPGVAENALAESLRQELALFEEDLFEVKMTSKNLAQLAKAIPGATVGLEFEMIVPNVSNSYDGGDMEPDYEQDERVRDIDDAVNFFDDGDYNDRSTIRRLRAEMEDAYYEWKMEKVDELWHGNQGFEFFSEYLDREEPFDDEEAEEEARNELQAQYGDELDVEEFEKMLFALVDEKRQNYTQEQWDEQGSNYDNAYDEFRDEQSDDISEYDWLGEQGIRYASDVESNYDVTWPYWTSPEEDEIDAKEIALNFMNYMGYDTIAVGDYHGYGGGYKKWVGNGWVSIGSDKPMDAFTVEPDGSLTGDNSGDTGLEFVSPPIPLDQIGDTMKKVQAWASENGVYTGKSNATSMHTNISIPGYDLDKLDYLKAAILLGDEYVLREFDRIGNTYAKPAIEKVKSLVQQKPEKAQELLDKMKSQLNAEASKLIHSGQTDKYTSINTKDNRIEFRSPGGDYLSDIADKPQKMIDTINRMVVTLDAAMDPNKYKEEYQKKLYKILTGQQSGREARTGAKQEMKASDKDLLNIFSRYAAGELPKQALKSFVRQAQLERKVKAGKETGKMWWNVVWDNGRRIEVVATNEQEAIAAAVKEWGIHPQSEAALSLRAKPLRPYIEPETTGAAGPTLNGRPSNPDGNYVIVDMTDETKPVYRYMAAGAEDALLVLRRWIQANPGQMLWNYKFDPDQRLGQPAAPTAQPAEQNQGNWGIWINANDRFANQPGSYSRNETPPLRRFPSREAAEQWIEQQRAERPNMRTDIEVREIEPASQSGTDTSQTDIENRLGWGSQSADANYEIMYRGSNPPQRRFVFIANTPAEAARKFDRWLAAQGLPANTEDYGFREIARPGSTLDLQRQRADQYQSVPIPGVTDVELDIPLAQRPASDAAQGGIVDVAGDNWSADFERRMQEPATAPQTLTRPGQGQQTFTGEWQVLDPEDREIYRFSGVGNNQSDANRVAMNWLRQNPGRMQAGVTVVPVMG